MCYYMLEIKLSYLIDNKVPKSLHKMTLEFNALECQLTRMFAILN